MVKDPEFIADIQRLNVELDPLPGEEVAQLIVRTLNVPAAVRERAKLAFGGWLSDFPPFGPGTKRSPAFLSKAHLK